MVPRRIRLKLCGDQEPVAHWRGSQFAAQLVVAIWAPDGRCSVPSVPKIDCATTPERPHFHLLLPNALISTVALGCGCAYYCLEEVISLEEGGTREEVSPDEAGTEELRTEEIMTEEISTKEGGAAGTSYEEGDSWEAGTVVKSVQSEYSERIW